MMAETKGTPITRSGGFFIRVGWKAVGYSVERSTYLRYRMVRSILFLLALAIGISVVIGANYVFFNLAMPLIHKVLPDAGNYPEFWKLLINLSTLFFGGLIYWHIRAKVGEAMLKGVTPVHAGFGLVEQRSRAAKKRKREITFLLIILVLIFTVPVGMDFSLKIFFAIITGYFLAEGLYFKLVAPSKY
jgi:predicted lysophospholipase L1 biosynthesis ABC-type transport system permease subunit